MGVGCTSCEDLIESGIFLRNEKCVVTYYTAFYLFNLFTRRGCHFAIFVFGRIVFRSVKVLPRGLRQTEFKIQLKPIFWQISTILLNFSSIIKFNRGAAIAHAVNLEIAFSLRYGRIGKSVLDCGFDLLSSLVPNHLYIADYLHKMQFIFLWIISFAAYRSLFQSLVELHQLEVGTVVA